MDFLYSFLVLFLFGVFLKLADAHDEHGMTSFPGAGMIYGIIWGAIGAYMVMYSVNFHTLYLSILFYWIFKLKIDYTNHAVATIIMLSGAFLSGFQFQLLPIGLLLLSYIGLDYIKQLNKQYWKSVVVKKIFSFLKPQFVIGPVVFCIVTQDVTVLAYFASIIAKYVTIKVFKINQDIQESSHSTAPCVR